MNEITVARKRIPGIVRMIDEIAFQANLLKLNAAVEKAGGQHPETPWNADAANETLALIKESIAHSPVSLGTKVAVALRKSEAATNEISRVAKQLQRLKSAAPAATKQPFGESR